MIKKIGTHITDIRRNREGATAVEFALFALPLVMIILGILELAMLAAAGTILQGATDEAARLIRTGQIQAGADPRTEFEDMLCDKTDMFLDCSDIKFEAIVMGDGMFGGGDMGSAGTRFNADGDMDPRGFDPGAQNDVVLIRVAYRYPLLTPLVGPFFADGGSRANTRLLMSTTVIKNEPYSF